MKSFLQLTATLILAISTLSAQEDAQTAEVPLTHARVWSTLYEAGEGLILDFRQGEVSVLSIPIHGQIPNAGFYQLLEAGTYEIRLVRGDTEFSKETLRLDAKTFHTWLVAGSPQEPKVTVSLDRATGGQNGELLVRVFNFLNQETAFLNVSGQTQPYSLEPLANHTFAIPRGTNPRMTVRVPLDPSGESDMESTSEIDFSAPGSRQISIIILRDNYKRVRPRMYLDGVEL
ncbi:MAG: hypothetical protein ACFCU3_05430 [Verrucomicrobiales bacterium]